MNDSDAPRFQVGDKVRWTERSVVGGRDWERSGTVSAIGPFGATVAFVGPPHAGSTHVQFGSLTLVAPALYLDVNDAAAIEFAIRALKDHPVPGGTAATIKTLRSIIARAKRAPAKTETNDG